MASPTKRTPKATATKPLTKRKAWIALKAHYKQIQATHLRKLFEQDSKRGERFTLDALGIYFD